MRILSLTLKGFIRMGLGQITQFTIRPNGRLQLILGTNGSGKSSLLSELTPLPPARADFQDGGYKEIVIERAGKTYTLTSTFNGSGPGKHSFVDDEGVNLNQGGTGQVQTTLVQQYFGITSDLHNLLIGRENFTSMVPARRKEWLTKFSVVSYDFAIAYYNSLKQRLNETKNAIKIDKRHLVDETKKLVSVDQLAELKEKQNALHSLLNGLYAIAKPKDTYSDVHMLKSALIERMTSLNAILRRSLSGMGEFAVTVDDWAAVEQQIEADGREISVCQHILTEKGAEYDEARKAYDLVTQQCEETAQALEARIDDLATTTAYLKLGIRTEVRQHVQGDLTAALANFKHAATELKEIFETIPLNPPERPYGKKELEAADYHLTRLRQRQYQITQTLQHLDQQIKDAECQHRDGLVSCPSCSHSWSLSDKESEVATLQQRIVELRTELEDESKLKEISDTEQYIVACKAYYEFITRLHHAFRSLNPNYFVANFRDLYFPYEEIKTSPMALAMRVMDIEGDLAKLQEMQQKEQEIVTLKEKLNLSRQAEQYNVVELEERLKRLDNAIATANATIIGNNHRIDALRKYQSTVRTIQSTKTELEKLMEEGWELTAKEVSRELNHLVHERIKDVQIGLGQVTNEINGIETQHSIVEAISKKIVKLETDQSVLECLVNNLSPEKGLIADGLIGFINAYIKQMNLFIRKVWTYPMVIQPCHFSEEEQTSLDYRFPMTVAGMRRPVPDISRGSAGQQEIVNLAFRLTAMRYLGMSDYPLHLDEFGSKMDEKHRLSAIDLIKSILDQEHFSQLFIVSHDSHQYGSLSNPEVCVLCDTNVTLPAGIKVNQHVEIS